MPFTTREGARIYWRAYGTPGAMPLVLLHSIGTDMGIYDLVAPLLEPHFRMARIDLRGHGASDATEGEYTLEMLSRDVLAVMDDAGFGKAIVCGTSLGGMIAMELAGLTPERASGLVLANTSAQMSPALWPERIATVRSSGMAAVADGWASRHFSEAFMLANPARVASHAAHIETMSPVGYAGNAAAIRDMDVFAKLPRIVAPTLVIGGDLDAATPFAGHGDRIAAAIPGATVDLLPCGHLACIEQPEAFARVVLALAARCER